MKVKVVGIQNVDYTSRKTGKPVKGTALHVIFKDAEVAGEAVDSIFVSDALEIGSISQIQPGMVVDVEYNRRGFVSDVAIVK